MFEFLGDIINLCQIPMSFNLQIEIVNYITCSCLIGEFDISVHLLITDYQLYFNYLRQFFNFKMLKYGVFVAGVGGGTRYTKNRIMIEKTE